MKSIVPLYFDWDTKGGFCHIDSYWAYRTESKTLLLNQVLQSTSWPTVASADAYLVSEPREQRFR